jgi:glycosyltransferase involved in cell wall biosynthesis
LSARFEGDGASPSLLGTAWRTVIACRPVRIALVMPAYDEEQLLGESVEGVLPHVERLIIVDDGSRDGTPALADAIVARSGGKVRVIHHDRNRGIGAAVVTGIRALLDEGGVDGIGIIASDAQCDPALVPRFRRILDQNADLDVAKGSRFLHRETLARMPRFRYWGNRGVSTVMKMVVGYWGMSDILHGYLVARVAVFRAIELDRIADGYDLENTMMAEFRRLRCRFGITPSPSRYGREKSKIVMHTQIPKTLRTMAALLVQRLTTGELPDRALPLLLVGALPSAGLTLPLAVGLMRATSPTVRMFPESYG